MRSTRGFTLVELLVAMSIVAIMVGLLSSSLRTSIRTADNVEERLQRSESLYMMHRFLRGQLERAIPLPIIVDDMVDDIEFSGDSASVNFVTAVDNTHTRAGYSTVTLRIERDPGFDDGRLHIVGSWRPRLATEDAGLQPADRILARDIAAAEFTYLGRGRMRAAGWQSEWRHRGELPALVRLSMTTHEGRELPDLVAAPQLSMPYWTTDQ